MAQFQYTLTEEQLDQFGNELEALRRQTLLDLGTRDAEYIRMVVKVQRRAEMLGRGLLFAGLFPPAWLLGVMSLTAAKILDAGEIGHNVMHGQYDWMNDPTLNSKNYHWEFPSVNELWRHSHNYGHHTFTNIQGMDRDIGFGVLRMSDQQRWNLYFLFNPLWALLLAVNFSSGIALHEVEVENLIQGKRDKAEVINVLKAVSKKSSRRILKDYIMFPALAGPFAFVVFAGNASANLLTNMLGFMVIFCGHFPDGAAQFPASVLANETRGKWYYRQILGSANIDGGKIFHLLSGNLSHQIEHHLFPEIPAHRYGELAVKVREICKRYDLPYNSDSLTKQFGTVVKRILRLSLPS